MRILLDGQPHGSATVLQTLLENGGKQVVVTMSLGEKSPVKVRQESVYDNAGGPVRKIQEVIDAKGNTQHKVVVSFDEAGAHCSIYRGGAPQVTTHELVKGAPRNNPSEFWFIKSRPRVGDKVTYYRYDVSASKWTLAETRYIGKKTIEIAGEKVDAHLIDSGAEGQTFVDDKGNPLVLVVGKIRMERTK